jgi:hypothetical protein
MAKKPEQPKENYLKVPYHILNLPDIGLCEKILLAWVYSFGEKGCWQSNKTLAEHLMVSADTISRWISKIKKYLHVQSPKGYSRTMWAKSHPDVQAATKLWHRGKEIPKPNACDYRKNAEDPRQKCGSDYRKSAIRLPQECRTTNNQTIKETIKDTTATPTPLPAGGQASALLEDRKATVISTVEQLKHSLGRGGQRSERLPEAEFQQRRQQLKKALLGDKKI